MELFLIAISSALWFGTLTSISPCRLATNITAMSFLGKEIVEPKRIFWAGIQYTIGRALAYFSISAVVLLGLLSISDVAQFLQKNMNQIIGPLMVLVGFMLLGVIRIPSTSFGSRLLDKVQEVAKKSSRWGAGLLGFAFALAFCPISAGLFFWIPYSTICKIPLLFYNPIFLWSRNSHPGCWLCGHHRSGRKTVRAGLQ